MSKSARVPHLYTRVRVADQWRLSGAGPPHQPMEPWEYFSSFASFSLQVAPPPRARVYFRPRSCCVRSRDSSSHRTVPAVRSREKLGRGTARRIFGFDFRRCWNLPVPIQSLDFLSLFILFTRASCLLVGEENRNPFFFREFPILSQYTCPEHAA